MKHSTSSVTQEDSTAAPAESDPEANLEEDYQRLQNHEGWHDERLPEVRVESHEPDLRIDVNFGCQYSKRDVCECTQQAHDPQHDA
jgi:hypothetical protein